MKGRAVSYLPEELAWIEARKDWPRAELHRAFVSFWRREDVTLDNLKALCFRKRWMTGRTGGFPKGITPHNKGKKMPPEIRAKRLATAFRKGSVPANRKPLWTERMGRSGYIEISVPERNPYTGHSTRYRQKHTYLWEQVNGPVPDGHALKCLDGDKTNCDPANWIAIPRALLPRLSGANRGRIAYDTAPPDLKPALLAIARLEHAARKVAP